MVHPGDDVADMPEASDRRLELLLCHSPGSNHLLQLIQPRDVFVFWEGHGKCAKIEKPSQDCLCL